MGIPDIINLIFTQPIFNGLMILYHLFNDFGLSIIVLTITIRLLLFPLTLQQLKSTKATQALQPQIAELKKKYGKDQQGLMIAQQALYKEYGINPLAGCLPLLVQLPVLYGLFFAFSAVLNDNKLAAPQNLLHLNNFIYPFLPKFAQFPNINLDWFTFINPHWFISLGSPDPTHILPILAGLATFIQLRMSQPKTVNTSGSTDVMTQQMKMMQYIMPIITIFFGWNFPAGLALYWTTSTTFSMIQQYFVTGWGSLLIVPNFVSGSAGSKNSSNSNGKAYTGDSRKETKLLQETTETKSNGVGTGPVASRMQNTTYRNGSSTGATRRAKGGSASARRRTSNQKKNPARG